LVNQIYHLVVKTDDLQFHFTLNIPGFNQMKEHFVKLLP